MSSPPSNLPLKDIPGSYGLPLLGPIKDRYDYFYNQGRDEFFRIRINKYKSTVFRTNMVPGPFISSDHKVIILLDAASYPVLFDNSKVEKKNTFDGTFMPSVNFTGGYRVCSYLDPSEPKHHALKSYFFSLLASKHNNFITLLQKSLAELFTNMDQVISAKKEVEFNDLSDNAAFNYVFELFCGERPSAERLGLGDKANKIADLWLVPQLAPLITFNLPKILSVLEDILLHTFPIPAFLVKSRYSRLYKAYSTAAGSLLDEAKNFGIEKDEACHNLIFLTCFNMYGGLKVMFPALFKWIGRAGEGLHRSLADEIRTVVKREGGVTFASLEQMPLMKSVVYEVLRIEPPVPFQCGHAKEDLVIASHDARFKIKKGETIFGFQPFATKDPKVFANAEKFIPDRFVGVEGEKMLKYVFWSNGRETEDPTADDKQCPGKNLVVLTARVMLAEFFLRYDSFTSEDKVFLLGNKVTFKSLTKKA